MRLGRIVHIFGASSFTPCSVLMISLSFSNFLLFHLYYSSTVDKLFQIIKIFHCMQIQTSSGTVLCTKIKVKSVLSWYWWSTSTNAPSIFSICNYFYSFQRIPHKGNVLLDTAFVIIRFSRLAFVSAYLTIQFCTALLTFLELPIMYLFASSTLPFY